MEKLSDKLLLMAYKKTLQMNKEKMMTEDFIEIIKAEIRKRGLSLKER
jgi:hypothetical protein